MALVSIIIPAYNVGAALDDCLASVCAQTHRAIEILVVDDASTDDTGDRARRWADSDDRVRLVTHATNRGRHRARMSGVRALRGDFALFLDGDDELCGPEVVELLLAEMERDPVDVLRFGLEAKAVSGTPQEEAQQLEAWSNVPMGSLTGAEALCRAFSAEEHNALPWHVTHRLFEASLLVKAFSRMADERLERAEDAYEYLVIASLAASERDACGIRGYRYNLGSGIMNARMLGVDAFLDQAQALRSSYCAARAYAQEVGDEPLEGYARDFEHKLLETIGNLWHERVEDAGKPEAALRLVDLVGPDETCAELYRFVRDRAYEFVAHKTAPAPDDRLFLLLGIANLVHAQGAGLDAQEHERAEAMRAVACGHVGELIADPTQQAALAGELEQERERVAALEGSRSMRLGRAATAPLRALRSLALRGRGPHGQ